MTRRATVAAVVAVLCAVVATVRAEPASAYYNSITTAADWEVVNGWLNSTAAPPAQSITTNPSSGGAWFRARVALGRIGLMGATGSGLTSIALGAGALYVGWEIGHASGLSDWAYGRMSGATGTAQPSAGTIRAYRWKYEQATGAIFTSDPATTCGDGASPATYCWVPTVRYSINSGSTWSERPGYIGSGCVTDAPSPSFCDSMSSMPTTYNGAKWNADQGAMIPELEGSGFARRCYNTGTGSGSSDVVMTCYWAETNAQWTARFRPTEQRPYNSSTDAARKTGTSGSTFSGYSAQPAPEYGSGTATTVETELESDDTLSTEIGTILHPTTETQAETVALPQPRLNETATQYRSRLRALGFLGTITLSENAGVDVLPEFGPNVVTSITVGTDTYPLLDPWPDPPPTLTVPGASTTVTIEHNPSTAPAPAPGGPGSAADPPPGNAPPPGGGGTITVGDCTCPAPDFSPITDVDYGDKFPFGVVSLVGGFLGTTLNASPDAPVFDFDFGWLGITPHYVVDLDVMDAYMATFRAILSFCIWIGGLWWFGSRWFGFSGSGDPGSAVDDVL